MTLTDTQRQAVIQWIGAGAKLSEIQNRLASEFGLRLTYMEARFLVDDLKLVPKDAERPKDSALTAGAGKSPTGGAGSPAAAPAASAAAVDPEDSLAEEPLPMGGGPVTVAVDQIMRPGAILSGKVTFSDGQLADWYLDQMGRLGVVPKQAGYKPTAADAQEFQLALQREVQRLGY